MNVSGTGKNPAIARRLERVLEQTLKRREIINVSMAVERVDGSFRWNGAAGEADMEGRLMTRDTPWYSGGIEAFHNAVLTIMLVERGRLDLDLPFLTYLDPAFAGKLHAPGGRDRTSEITLRHLLGHSSGLADWLEDSPPGRGTLGILETVLREGDHFLSRRDILQLVRERLRPHFPPQDAFDPKRIRYSNTNNLLLALVLESVMGKGLPEIHREMIWERCGMGNTWFPGAAESAAESPAELPAADGRRPAPAELHFQGEQQNLSGLVRSLGGFYTTLEDTISFLRTVVTGAVYNDPARAAMMTPRWTRFSFPLDRVAMRQPAWPLEYGLGVMRFQLRRIFTPRRMMPSLVGHTGSTGSWLLWSPERDLLLVGTVNELTAGALPFQVIAPRIMAISALR
ncbi:MAG: class A beta-lactamase-related serine hydrolase [Spirochaetaceae bacterium]|nr:MAG: class A beta-lactamase-related serine hydrolase [Spirochaetaceae bacterium]